MEFIEKARESRSYVFIRHERLGVLGFIPGRIDDGYVFHNFWTNSWVRVEDVFPTREEAAKADGFARYA